MTREELDAIALEVAGEVYKIRNVETLSMASGARDFARLLLERIKKEPMATVYEFDGANLLSDGTHLYTLPEIEK